MLELQILKVGLFRITLLSLVSHCTMYLQSQRRGGNWHVVMVERTVIVGVVAGVLHTHLQVLVLGRQEPVDAEGVVGSDILLFQMVMVVVVSGRRVGLVPTHQRGQVVLLHTLTLVVVMMQ